jgi:hypothetical protein
MLGVVNAFGAACVAVALILGAMSSVWAQTRPPLKLTFLGCVRLNQAEVGRILEAELGGRLNAGDPPETTEVEVECQETRIVLRVRDPITRKGVSRLISLEKQQPEAHARLVALAATELVLASWSELEFNPRPRVEPEGPALAPELSAAALQSVQERRTVRGLTSQPSTVRRRRGEPPPSELRLAALASARTFFQNRGVLFGGGFRLGEELTHLVSWSIDGMTEAGRLWVNSGSQRDSVRFQTTTIGAAVLFFQRGRVLTGRVGGGLRLAVSAAEPSEADDSAGQKTRYVVTPLGWPMLMSSITLRLGRRAISELSLEGSYSTVPISGPDDEQKPIIGAWCAANLGFGVFL